MSAKAMETMRPLADEALHDMIAEIKARRQERFVISMLRASMPWWRRARFQLADRIWGLSTRWFCVCPWNGDEAWVTLPFIYFAVGVKHVELGLGKGKWLLSTDIRWRWD